MCSEGATEAAARAMDVGNSVLVSSVGTAIAVVLIGLIMMSGLLRIRLFWHRAAMLWFYKVITAGLRDCLEPLASRTVSRASNGLNRAYKNTLLVPSVWP